MRDITIGDWTKLGSTIKAARTRAGLSQQETAGQAGVSRSWLARVEAGHRGAEFEQIIRLLDALGLTVILRSEAPEPDRPGTRAAPALRVSLDSSAMQELTEKHHGSAAIRRSAWSTAASGTGLDDKNETRGGAAATRSSAGDRG